MKKYIIILGDFKVENKKINFKTDMADERVDEYKKLNNLSSVDGIKVEEDDSLEFAKVVNVEVLNENGSNVIDKEIGKYITIECKDINYLEDTQKEMLSQKIKEIILQLINKEKASILVVGLGNSKMTPDALGSSVTSKLEITRHLLKFAKEFVSENTREISSICPGVLGTTGIETVEIVESVAEKIKPDVLIVIDSLLSQSIERLGKTIQLTDKGIVPGSGVGNERVGIKENILNIPVIAIGVPTVVESATITNECINIFIDKITENGENIEFIKLKEKDNYFKIKEALLEKDYNMIVVPKDIDELIDNVSSIIADSINMMV